MGKLGKGKVEKAKKTKKGERGRKKLPVWALILIILGALAVAAAIAVAALGFGLLNRISRPVEPTQFEEEADLKTPAPELTATPTSLPVATPAPTAQPTPTPEVVLPLSDVYGQTRLSEDQLTQMQDNNKKDGQYLNVMLIGVDRRSGSGNSNTDTMMIATLDTEHGRLKLTTVMRDMLVDIPEHGYGKLNSAAPLGGIDTLMATLNSTFCMELKHYVLVDFDMFEQIVDAMGGITLNMTAAEISAANDCIAGLNKQRSVVNFYDGFIFAEAGNVKLTGKQALGYARIRHIDSDFSRTKRQFKVLNTAFAKFKRMSAAKKYALLYKVLPLVETNMNNSDIVSAMMTAFNMDTDGLVYYRVPADDTYQSGKYERKAVLFTDLPQNAWGLHQFIYESATEGENAPELEPGASLPPRTPNPESSQTQLYWQGLGILPTPGW